MKPSTVHPMDLHALIRFVWGLGQFPFYWFLWRVCCWRKYVCRGAGQCLRHTALTTNGPLSLAIGAIRELGHLRLRGILITFSALTFLPGAQFAPGLSRGAGGGQRRANWTSAAA